MYPKYPLSTLLYAFDELDIVPLKPLHVYSHVENVSLPPKTWYSNTWLFAWIFLHQKHWMFLSFSCHYALFELIKFQVSQTHLSFTPIIFPAGFTGQGVSIRMLHWLHVSRTPAKYLIICFWWAWYCTIWVHTCVLTCRECFATTKDLLFEYLTLCLNISSR